MFPKKNFQLIRVVIGKLLAGLSSRKSPPVCFEDFKTGTNILQFLCNDFHVKKKFAISPGPTDIENSRIAPSFSPGTSKMVLNS